LKWGFTFESSCEKIYKQKTEILIPRDENIAYEQKHGRNKKLHSQQSEQHQKLYDHIVTKDL
jgi:hypothetical protein